MGLSTVPPLSKIWGSRSYRDLKFSPVVHFDKRWESAKFQISHFTDPYFARQSVNCPLCSYPRIHIWTKVLSLRKIDECHHFGLSYLTSLYFTKWLVKCLYSSLWNTRQLCDQFKMMANDYFSYEITLA